MLAQNSAEKVLQIRDLKGLDTRKGVLALQPNEFRRLNNITLDDVGAIKKRKGYSSYVTFTGIDSIVGIYNAVYSDGSSELLIVTDPDTLGYGHLMKWDPLGSFTRTDTLWVIRDTTPAAISPNDGVWCLASYGGVTWAIQFNHADTLTTSYLVDAIADSITVNNTGVRLPKDPGDLLKDPNWQEISHPKAEEKGHRTFENTETGERLRYDEGKPGELGYRGEAHWHRENPNSINRHDEYLDANGNPVPRNSPESHLSPNE